MKIAFLFLFIGAALTSYAEYHFHYNLFDYAKDFVARIYARVKGIF